MRNRIVAIAIILIAAALLLFGVLLITDRGKATRTPELVEQMLLDRNCLAPCFFGESLDAKTYDETRAVLDRNEIMKGVEVAEITDGVRQALRWQWPNHRKEQLTSAGLNMETFFQYRYDDWNSIQFRDGILTKIRLIILIHLDDLIALLGEPQTVTVGIYRTEAAMLMFNYDEYHLTFLADLYCLNPQLSPDTPIWAYEFYAGPKLDPTLNPTFEWVGYDTQVNCNFPPP